jgi:hypothetical protein
LIDREDGAEQGHPGEDLHHGQVAADRLEPPP